MATFKVGQRVRVIKARHAKEIIGMETTITSEGFVDVWGDFGYRTQWSDANGYPGHLAEHLAPLTDPGADAFIERIKKLAREPQPVKETEVHAQGTPK